MTRLCFNEAHYSLDREVAKISAFSSSELEKYEYLTGKNLGENSRAVELAKFEYSSLGKSFNKGDKRVRRKRQKGKTFEKSKKC